MTMSTPLPPVRSATESEPVGQHDVGGAGGHGHLRLLLRADHGDHPARAQRGGQPKGRGADPAGGVHQHRLPQPSRPRTVSAK